MTEQLGDFLTVVAVLSVLMVVVLFVRGSR